MSHAFTRVLLATEHTEHDSGAEAVALAMAQRCGLPLHGVLPVQFNAEFEVVAPELAARADAQAHARCQALESAAARQGVRLSMTVRRGEELFLEIVGEARAQSADLIVTRRRGRRGLLANLLVGEMVGKVVAHAPCSVLICPRGAAMWRRQVLVAIDPQGPALPMLAQAASIAQECGLPLRVLCVATSEAARPAAEQALSAALLQARASVSQVDGDVRVGRPHQEIVAAAAAVHADLVVVGRHGQGSLGRAWIGGTAQKVIGLADCPVLVHVDAESSQ